MRYIAVLLVAATMVLAAGDNEAPLPFGPIWGDHDTGSVKTSVTALGGIGYTAPDSGRGLGFRFPKTMITSRLYHASFLVGNSPTYIVDRFYGNPAPSLNRDFAIVDSLRRDNWYGGQEWSGMMSDARHPTPKGLRVWVHSIGLPDTFVGKSVIFRYDIWNSGTTALDGMLAGLWADFDISANGGTDIASTDMTRRLAFSRDNTVENPCVGIVVLEPHQASNVSVVYHAVYVYPTDSCVTESQKYRWLTGTLHQDSSRLAADHSDIVATGPFDLPAGGRSVVAFAMVAGRTRADMNAQVDSLQAWYDRSVAVEEPGSRGPVPSVLSVAPNPVTGRSRISFGAPVKTGASLMLYDHTGRCVEKIWSGKLNGRAMEVPWIGAGRLKNGIYFLRLEAGGVLQTTKAVVAR